jgi:hypothetical protein
MDIEHEFRMSDDVVQPLALDWRAGNLIVTYRRDAAGRWRVVLMTRDREEVVTMSASAARTLAKRLLEEAGNASSRARDERKMKHAASSLEDCRR